jgi:hypothetical protein
MSEGMAVLRFVVFLTAAQNGCARNIFIISSPGKDVNRKTGSNYYFNLYLFFPGRKESALDTAPTLWYNLNRGGRNISPQTYGF